MTSHHLHLVSDATGETVNSIARACLVQFDGIEPIEHSWTLVRTRRHLEQVLKGIEAHPGPVLYTMVNEQLRTMLQDGCRRVGVPSVSILDPVIRVLALHYERGISGRPGKQHEMDQEYFSRIEAMNYALAHDDGQAPQDLAMADVILVGVSRTSKTPTCMYLANRGIRAANVPFVPGVPLPDALYSAAGRALVVGLTKEPSRLVDLRRNRLRLLTEAPYADDYADPEKVRAEVTEARRLFGQRNWPVIDVTRRSIEETAAAILTLYQRHREQALT